MNRQNLTEVYLNWSDRIVPGKEGLYWGHFNKAYNFFKHADRDPDEKFQGIDVTANDFVIFFSVMFIRALNGPISERMNIFSSWFVLQYPQVIADNRLKDLVNGYEASMRGYKMSREQLLLAGKQLIEQN